MFKMRKEDKAKVVAALRSGKYVQGREVMKQIFPDGTATYCCLGVMQEEISGEVEKNFFINDYTRYRALPSRNWCEANGIINAHNIDGLVCVLVPSGFTKKGVAIDAPIANDRLGLTFNQIADLWEHFVEGY